MDKKKLLKEEVVWEAFKIFDVDGNGTVTKKELLKILTGRASDKIRQVHGDTAIDKFLDEYDQTGDDVIDFDEFMAMLNSATVAQAGPLKQRKTVVGPRPLDGCIGTLKNTILAPCSAVSKAEPTKEPTSGRKSERSERRRSQSSKETSSRSPERRKSKA